MSKLLVGESPLLVLPGLATRVGLNEAIFLQQLHWLTKDKRPSADGHQWLRRTYPQWKRTVFPFWSTRTIERAADSLAKQRLILIEQLDKSNRNRDNFYAIDRKFFQEWEIQGGSSGGLEHDKMAPSEYANLADSEHDKMAPSYKDQNLKKDLKPDTDARARGVSIQEVPRLPGSDDEHDSKALKFSIAELEDPPTAFYDAVEADVLTRYPDLGIPFRDIYELWFLKYDRLGGVARSAGQKATLRQYHSSIKSYCKTWVLNNKTRQNGNGHGKQRRYESASERNLRNINETLEYARTGQLPQRGDEDNRQGQALLATTSVERGRNGDSD